MLTMKGRTPSATSRASPSAARLHPPRRPPRAAAASSSPGSPADAAAAAAVFQAIARSLAELADGGRASQAPPAGAALRLDRLSYHPPGAPAPLLSSACLSLPPHGFGLIYGRSGSGKTTLLQLVAGLLKPTSGAVRVVRGGEEGESGAPLPVPSSSSAAAPTVGLVFQFPERHFLGDTLVEELTFGWPADPASRAARGMAAQAALRALGLSSIPLDTRLRSLSDGYKRRVALAVQLARSPDVLLLDEPLAGLDWRARGEIVGALKNVKAAATVLAVSHDLTELAPLVDAAWVMRPGGVLRKARWPPGGKGGGGEE